VSATLQVLINGSKSELEELMINEIVVRVPAIVVLAILWAIAFCARPISAHGRIRSRRRGCGQSRGDLRNIGTIKAIPPKRAGVPHTNVRQASGGI
jgi:hypothetical protein